MHAGGDKFQIIRGTLVKQILMQLDFYTLLQMMLDVIFRTLQLLDMARISAKYFFFIFRILT